MATLPTKVTTTTPVNINPLSPNGYRFAITKLPELTYFSQQVNLPGIQLGDPAFANPFASVPIPGDHITYDTLQVQFIVDEGMANYLAIYNWIIALGFPQNYDQYVSLISSDQRAILNELASNYSDATLEILDNNNKPIKTVHFVDVFPTSIESLTFHSNDQDVNYLIGNATFRFSYYEFVT
jgi:hypothetical protein